MGANVFQAVQFDAVAVCNGHYSKPYVPDIVGADEYPRPQYHSHDYREPSAFADKTVVIFGTSSSGQDIAREVADVAKSVYLCGRHKSVDDKSDLIGHTGNIYMRPNITKLGPRGEVWFNVSIRDAAGAAHGSWSNQLELSSDIFLLFTLW